MTEVRRHKRDENADRVLRWLYEHRGEFEQAGVSEASLAGALGLSEQEVTAAVDHLENREALARLPHHDAAAGFLLQPARGWADIREELAGDSGAGKGAAQQ